MPKEITSAQMRTYLQTLLDTGNATLAAEWAGVSRSWVYLRRQRDAWFDGTCRTLVALARERLAALREGGSAGAHTPHPPSPDGLGPSLSREGRGANAETPPLLTSPTTPPHPAAASGGCPSPASGRGAGLVVQLGSRVQVRRGRAGEWGRETEERFLLALAATRDAPIAAYSAGVALSSAYRRRQAWPGFAARWRAALRCDDPDIEAMWAEAMVCFFEGTPQSPENPVKITSIDEVIRLYERYCLPGPPRGRPPG